MKLRTSEYFIQETFRSLRRNNWMSFASIGTVAVSLFVLGVFLLLVLNMNRLASSLESQVQISVYLADGLSESARKDIASDIEAHDLRELRRRFEDKAHVRVASFHFPLSNADRADLQGERIDSIVCMNVLEHIEHDRETLTDFASVLQPGGHMVLLVPAMPALYGTLDKALLHFRRYDKAGLAQLVTDCGFEVQQIRFLNRLGVAGWWLNSRVLRRRVLPKGQLAAFKWLMPLLKREEQRPPSFGMSLLVLATKR